MTPAAMEFRSVSFRYPGAEREAVTDVSLSFRPGCHHAVLGPNGAGKSTLLRLGLGLLEPSRGAIRLEGRPVGDWKRRAVARRVGMVTQEPPAPFPLTVRSFVEMGRNPYLRPWAGLESRDRDVVERSLERVDMAQLAGRRLTDLSGGELQRAKVARALAQEPRTLLLDEPTAHLDLGHEVRIFRLVERLVQEDGLTAITVTHNLNLASRFARRLVLLVDGRVVEEGTAREVIRPGPVERAYGWPVTIQDAGPEGRIVVPRTDTD